ncbi:hypothetical protein [Serratia sp. DD3]|uniref:hypothetical protein n=1 Tax=Serratia sp. DD3 TaxID=1410619 RepID=UPI0003C5118E|nr:hypothetical protein [Serratia sp. DD3]KEY57606.1 hypothetical protein SRDD_35870 [Serratia sp. DD3]
MKMKLPLLLLTLLFTPLTKADYVSVFYTGWVNPANNLNIAISNFTVPVFLYQNIFLTRTNGSAQAVKCDVVSFPASYVHRRFWLLVPNETVAQGMTFIHNTNPGLTQITNVPVPPGYTLWASGELLTNMPQPNANIPCPIPGSIANIARISNFFGGILYRLQNPIGGAYNIRLPIYAGMQFIYTSTSSRPSAAVFDREVSNLLLSAGPEYINIRATVQAECSLSSGGSDININHGPIMLQQGVTAYPSNDYTLGLNCTSPASASFSLKGTNPVSGKSENYTQCGPGGTCQLLFDIPSDNIFNQYSATTARSSGNKNILIRSIYQPNAVPIAGDFTGSAVLTVLIN